MSKMGATNFGMYTVGKYKSAREAYNELCEEATYEYGHDPYSGTIATTNGFFVVENHPRVNTAKFDGWEGNYLDELEKRECACVPITGAALKKMKDNSRYKGKKGVKAFYFFGWAAE